VEGAARESRTPYEAGEVVRRLQGCDHEDQAWFWTDTWQAGERDASEDIRLGRTTTVETLDDMFQELDN
jgi:hypothetical protein